MSHELKREYGGEGMMGWIRPTCSCGWRGIEYYAYNDYQHTEVNAQEMKHRIEIANEEHRLREAHQSEGK